MSVLPNFFEISLNALVFVESDEGLQQHLVSSFGDEPLEDVQIYLIEFFDPDRWAWNVRFDVYPLYDVEFFLEECFGFCACGATETDDYAIVHIYNLM